MTSVDFIPANFTISDGGKRGISLARAAFNTHSKDRADVASVGWGVFKPDNESHFENVVVSFYSKTQHDQIVEMIQNVSGVDLVFFTTPFYAARFDKKVLDFAEDRGFFLR